MPSSLPRRSLAIVLAAQPVFWMSNVALAQSLLPRNLGTALGLMNGVAFGIGSLGVALVGIVVTRYGADAGLTVVSLAPLLAAAAYVVVIRRR